MTTITIEQELLDQAKDAFAKVIEWDARRDYLIPYKVRDPVHAAQKKIDAALAAPATAPDELEQLRKDAERYRWLRKTTNWVSSKGQRINVRDFPKSWDEHIDDAMKDKP